MSILRNTINIFIPTYVPAGLNRADSTKKCLRRLKEVIDVSLFNYVVYIGDNNSVKEVKTWLKDFCSKDNRFILYLHPQNIGKARIINYMFNNLSRDCDYFCSMDSDMYIKNDGGFFEELVFGLEAFNREEKKIEMTVCDMDYNGTHVYEHVKINKEKQGHKFRCTRTGGTAGGVLMMRCALWRELGGYVEGTNIFGGNDGFMVRKITRHRRQMVGIAMGAIADHIGNSPIEYLKWKAHQAKHLSTLAEEFQPDSGYFERGYDDL